MLDSFLIALQIFVVGSLLLFCTAWIMAQVLMFALDNPWFTWILFAILVFLGLWAGVYYAE